MGASADRGRPLVIFASAALLTLALDQVSKALATANLHPFAPQSLLGTPIALTFTRNVGSAFGLPLPARLLLVAGAVVCLAILWYVTLGRGGRPQHALPLGLVFGGSVGNLVDRIRIGGVIDFIDLRVWPVFNVADIAITVGVALLAIRALKRRA